MGYKVPDYPPGEPCSLCWGSGQPFGAVPTPRFLDAAVSDAENAGGLSQHYVDWLNGTHTLEQDENYPCQWWEIYQPESQPAALLTLFIADDVGGDYQTSLIYRSGTLLLWAAFAEDKCQTGLIGGGGYPITGGQADVILPS